MTDTESSPAAEQGWTARFVPQVWVRDYAVDVVHPEVGPTEWELSDAEAQSALPEARRRCADLDFLRDTPGAPDWVKEWNGPFYIELIDPEGFTVDYSS